MILFDGKRQAGFAMGVVMVTMLILALVSGYLASIGASQRRLMGSVSGKRTAVYYRAHAGVVHGHWRIRAGWEAAGTGFTACNPAGDFSNPAYTCDYSLDVNGDGTMDTSVRIEAETNATKQRRVIATGLDT